jgi:hypothetical protein
MLNGNAPVLLTDEQMRKFITEGFLILKTDFPAEFHKKLMDEMEQVYEKEGNPGNNVLPRIGDLHKVFDHPAITGALTSILGADYMLHTHRAVHYNANANPGGWHKDSYWGYKKIRNHHPWWAMIMYFPQDTPVELGPTGVMPGTQNYESRVFQSDDTKEERLASGEAGTFAVIHYDIWHRATSNLKGMSRFMLKFEFTRTQVPESPTWNQLEKEWKQPSSLYTPFARHDAMWKESWNWLSGEIGSLADTASDDVDIINELMGKLIDEYEPNALNAAYDLACRGGRGVEALLEGLHHNNISVSRLCAYGLSVSGEKSISGLIGALQSEREETVSHAVFALGECRHLAKEAVPELIQLNNHRSELIRRTVVEALGMMGTPSDDIVSALVGSLQDGDVQVRFTAALSLCRLGVMAEAAVPQLEIALDDENRYVRGHAAEALRYIGTERAKDVLIKYLFKTRWCSITTPENIFYP